MNAFCALTLLIMEKNRKALQAHTSRTGGASVLCLLAAPGTSFNLFLLLQFKLCILLLCYLDVIKSL